MAEETVKQAMQPLLLTACVLGLSVYSAKKFHLSVLYILTKWSAYCYLYYYVVVMFKVEKFLLKMINIIAILNTGFITVISVIMSLYQDKKFRALLKRIATIDSTLMELDTTREYRKLRAFSKWILIGWIVSSLLANISQVTWWIRLSNNRQAWIIPFVILYHQHVNMLVGLIFTTLVWYIGTRFDEICEHMKNLLLKHELRCTRRRMFSNHRDIICPNNYKHVLWTSMHLHLELCQIAHELNSMFAIQITLGMAVYLLYLIQLCHIYFSSVCTGFDFWTVEGFNIYIWMTIYVIKLFGLNYICESVCTKANKIDKIIHQLTNISRYADIHNEICQFVLQVIHHPLKFTGMGLFFFGNSFLWKFFVAITTFAILMMQMPK